MTYVPNAYLEWLTRPATEVVPPPSIDEVGWDILLALHGDKGCALGLKKLGFIVSVSAETLTSRLARLEEFELIRGVLNEVTRELRAILTPAGRALLDGYFAATNRVSGRLQAAPTHLEQWR